MKCKGCGVEIQTSNEEAPGYIPLDVLEARLAEGKEVYCKRCFKNVYYLINKVDLIPKEITPSEIKTWVRNRLKVQSTRIRLLSAKNERGVSGLLRFLKGKKEKRFITIGVTNVGKSSVLNALAGTNTLTISRYPGTTLKADHSQSRRISQ